jgi:intracellular sulfur oxidation DsrE/DsrF family protein
MVRAVSAQEVLPGVSEGQLFVADIELQTSGQFIALLERSEQLLLAGVPLPQEGAPVTFVLHGPVLESLLRDNYLENKRLVDLSAALSALGVIEVKACNAWMEAAGLEPAQLQPFVEPVPYGPGLVERLVTEENYRYF